ncbi:unnamed protein product, partial [Amoebophrya sp. A25]
AIRDSVSPYLPAASASCGCPPENAVGRVEMTPARTKSFSEVLEAGQESGATRALRYSSPFGARAFHQPGGEGEGLTPLGGPLCWGCGRRMVFEEEKTDVEEEAGEGRTGQTKSGAAGPMVVSLSVLSELAKKRGDQKCSLNGRTLRGSGDAGTRPVERAPLSYGAESKQGNLEEIFATALAEARASAGDSK